MGFLSKALGYATGGVVGDDPYGGTFTQFIPGIGDSIAQEKANQGNLAESALNRKFQERMSSTAYQRGMEDMKKAGLNPTLAYMQGGASAPTGSTATVQSAPKTALADMALKATTGIGGLTQQRTALEQQNTLNQSSIQLNATTAAKNVADAQRTRAETKGLGKKASEGELWDKFYKKINSVLDTSAKDQSMYKKMMDTVEKGKQNLKNSKNEKAKEALLKPLY